MSAFWKRQISSLEAVNELIAEYLAEGYLNHEGKDVTVPQALLSNSFGGADGFLCVPARIKGLLMIVGTNTFLPALIHEIGHFATAGKGNHAGMKDGVGQIAAKAGKAAEDPVHKEAQPKKEAWIEEARADLTGVYLRFVRDGAKPALANYRALLAGEPADGEHPPGDLRVQWIEEFWNTLT